MLYNWDFSTEMCARCVLSDGAVSGALKNRDENEHFSSYLSLLQRKLPRQMPAAGGRVLAMGTALQRYIKNNGFKLRTGDVDRSMREVFENGEYQRLPIWYRTKIGSIYKKMRDVFWWRAWNSKSNIHEFPSEDERLAMLFIRSYIETGILNDEQRRVDTALKSGDLGREFVNKHLTYVQSLPDGEGECMICTEAFETPDEDGIKEVAVKTMCGPVGHVLGDQCLARWCAEQNYDAENLRCPYCRQPLITKEERGIIHSVHEPMQESEEYELRSVPMPALLAVVAAFHNDADEGLKTKEYYTQLQDDELVMEVFTLFARIGVYFQHNDQAKAVVARLQSEREDEENEIPGGLTGTVDIAKKEVDEDLVRYWMGRLECVGVYVDPSIEISALMKRANPPLQIPGAIMGDGEMDRWSDYFSKFDEIEMIDRLYWTNFVAYENEE